MVCELSGRDDAVRAADRVFTMFEAPPERPDGRGLGVLLTGASASSGGRLFFSTAQPVGGPPDWLEDDGDAIRLVVFPKPCG